MKILICYHCLFVRGEPPEILPAALEIIREQMLAMAASGLLSESSEMIVGVNGGEESEVFSDSLLPLKAKVQYHGLVSCNECSTILMLEKWLPGHEDWYVLYLHSKGATQSYGDSFRTNWRNCMMKNLVTLWRRCVADLDAGHDAVGCHWMIPPQTPAGQHIFAGNFWWARSSFLLTLPSIMERERIKNSGITAIESRYESEVWLGNGPRIPKVKDYHLVPFNVHATQS